MDSKTASALGILTHLVEPADVNDTMERVASEGKPANKYPGPPRMRVTLLLHSRIHFSAMETCRCS
ncbi:MAG: hypothetical protein Ct9H90mP16_05960 [Candidatus Poseidoniales archaeon]|nr:MAG: hypothetical protein Ct9H90mP16_05960 [Candidatus Poseidoniales archaeon]